MPQREPNSCRTEEDHSNSGSPMGFPGAKRKCKNQSNEGAEQGTRAGPQGVSRAQRTGGGDGWRCPRPGTCSDRPLTYQPVLRALPPPLSRSLVPALPTAFPRSINSGHSRIWGEVSGFDIDHPRGLVAIEPRGAVPTEPGGAPRTRVPGVIPRWALLWRGDRDGGRVEVRMAGSYQANAGTSRGDLREQVIEAPDTTIVPVEQEGAMSTLDRTRIRMATAVADEMVGPVGNAPVLSQAKAAIGNQRPLGVRFWGERGEAEELGGCIERAWGASLGEVALPAGDAHPRGVARPRATDAPARRPDTCAFRI